MGNPLNNVSVKLNNDNFTVTGRSEFLSQATITGSHTSKKDEVTNESTYTFKNGEGFLNFSGVKQEDMGTVFIKSSVKDGEDIKSYAVDGNTWDNYSGIIVPQKTTIDYDLGDHGTITPDQNNWLRRWSIGWFTDFSASTQVDLLNPNNKGPADFYIYKK